MENPGKDKMNDAFSDEGSMTLEQAQILLDYIMEVQREPSVPKLIYPVEQEGVAVGMPVPPNLRCMGTSAKDMQAQIIKEADEIAIMLHQSEINASGSFTAM